jgi:hypothetical protein
LEDYFERKKRAISSFHEKQMAKSWEESYLFDFGGIDEISRDIFSAASSFNDGTDSLNLVIECSAHILNRAKEVRWLFLSDKYQVFIIRKEKLFFSK